MTPEEIRWREGCGALVLGDYARGFPLFESRMDCPGAVCYVPPRLRWHGEPDKRVLLVTEGGIGDAIFFLRYLPMMRERCPKIGLDTSTQPALNAIIPEWLRDTQGPWDAVCCLQSLPAVFGTTNNNIPLPFQIDPKILGDEVLFAQAHEVADDDMWVGVRWSGSPNMSANLARSMTFEQFSPIFEVEGVQFVSLYEVANRQRYDPLIDFRLQNLAHTAGLINGLDLVVTVDTSVAHLSASLGKRTWILVPRIEAYWIWGIGENVMTPWYPNARLIRQKRSEDWEDTMARVRKLLNIVVHKWRANHGTRH